MTIETKTRATAVVGQAGDGETEQAIACLTAAFETDPPVRWLYPELSQYHSHFPDFVRAFAGHAITNGTLQVTEGGAALWIAPGDEPDEAAIGEVVERTIPDARNEDVFSVFEAMDEFHIDEPHWYLPLMGVIPSRQGRGLGSALMHRVLQICDSEGVPAYLEATTDRSRVLYIRHGFKGLGKIEVAGCPVIYPMVRHPQ